MKERCILFAVLIASRSFAVQPDDALVQSLTETITELCPAAEFSTTNHLFTAKYDTMVYTLHNISKTGEVSPQAYQHEGPGFTGFVLSVMRMDGLYRGAAVSPQILSGPYYPTHFSTPSLDGGKTHYQIHFSCGPRLNHELKQAILNVLPGPAPRPLPSVAPPPFDDMSALPRPPGLLSGVEQ